MPDNQNQAEQQTDFDGRPKPDTTGPDTTGPDTTGAVKPTAPAPHTATTTVQSKEPEDAYLTGGQRNLQRRVLGLNVEGQHSQRPPGQSPGLHSTGSFTGVANGQSESTPSEEKE